MNGCCGRAIGYFDKIDEITHKFYVAICEYFKFNEYVILKAEQWKKQIMINGDNDDKVAIRYRVYLDNDKVFIQVQGKSNGVNLNQTFNMPLPEDINTINYWDIFETICKKFSLNPYRRIEKIMNLLKKDFPDLQRRANDIWTCSYQMLEYDISIGIKNETIFLYVTISGDNEVVTNLRLAYNTNIISIATQLRQAIKNSDSYSDSYNQKKRILN